MEKMNLDESCNNKLISKAVDVVMHPNIYHYIND